MTALTLLGYISAALLGQVVVAITFIALRRAPAPVKASAVRAVATAACSGLRDFRVRRRVNEDAACSQTSFYLEPVDGQPLVPYAAGQFLTFQIDLPDAQGTLHPVTRCYSLSDRPDPTAYRITVKRIPSPRDRPDFPPGLVSGYLHDQAVEGAILRVRPPAGAFVLGNDASAPVVLIAGGIGITPLFAMARAALATNTDRAIHLFYGVHDNRDLVFGADLAELAARHPHFRVTIVQSCPLTDEPDVARDYEAGFVDVALLRGMLPHGEHHFYICGPPPMMASLVPALRDWGVAGDAVHYEAFGPASIESAESIAPVALGSPLAIHFAQAERTISWTGEDPNLLEFAERNGLALASGCRSGSCGTCETRLVSGEVRYPQPPSFAVAEGYCLPCVGVPVADLVLDA